MLYKEVWTVSTDFGGIVPLIKLVYLINKKMLSSVYVCVHAMSI